MGYFRYDGLQLPGLDGVGESVFLGGSPMAGFGVGHAAVGVGFKFQPWKGIAKVTVKIGKGVGKFVATAVKNEPLTHLVTNLAQGKSFKASVSSAIKGGVHEFQTVAPIAESVVSFIPGVGTAVSVALATAVALSKGQKITDVVLSAVKGALPGGPATAAAFDTATKLGEGLLEHEKLGTALLGAARSAAVDVGSDVGIPSQLTESAFDAGVALAHGKKLQEVGFTVLGDLAHGNTIAEKMVSFGKALTHAKTTGQHVANVLIDQASKLPPAPGVFAGNKIIAPPPPVSKNKPAPIAHH